MVEREDRNVSHIAPFSVIIAPLIAPIETMDGINGDFSPKRAR
jgi:hypothetical protein